MPEQESKNWFDIANDFIHNSETSWVNFISAIIPWAAPLPAMYMSYHHMIVTLQFPVSVALPVGAVIELLGFATVSTILTFWSYNRRYTDSKKKAPFGLTIFAFTFYLGIVLTMNVLIDATLGTEFERYAVIAVRALLTLMSIPAALLVAVRALYHEVLSEMKDTKETNKRERAYKKMYGDQWFEMLYGRPEIDNFQKVSETSPKQWRTARKDMTDNDVRFIATKSFQDVMEQYKVSERTAYNWQKYASRELENM